MAKKKSKVEKLSQEVEKEQFVKQIQEEARREAVHNFIEKYWKQGITLIVLIVLICIVSISISAYQKNKRMTYASELHNIIIALETNKYMDAEESLTNFFNNQSVPNEIRTVAGMHLANFLSQKQDFERALKVYVDVKNITKDDFIKEVATLMEINLMIRSNDSKYDPEIKKLLVSSIGQEKTLNFLAKEQKLIFDLNNESKEEAKNTYNDLRVMDATENSEKRIKEVYESYIEGSQ